MKGRAPMFALAPVLAGAWALAACTRGPEGAGPALPEGQAEAQPQNALPDPLPVLAQDKDRPMLALLDHVLGLHFAQPSAAHGAATCVSALDGRSAEALAAPDEVMLMERHPALAPMSRCVERGGAWQDEERGLPASLVTLHSFTCSAQGSCTGWASTQTGAVASPSFRYTMAYGEGEWRFSRDPRLMAPE